MPPLTAAPANVLRRQLTQIPDLVTQAQLDLGIPRGRGLGGGIPTNPPESRPPFDLAILDTFTGGWYDGQAREAGDEPSIGACLDYWCWKFSGQGCTVISTAVDYLLRIHDEAIEQPFADEYAAQIAWQHRRLTQLAGPLRWRPVPVACLRCAAYALEMHEDGTVRCGSCGHRTTRAQYAADAADWYAQSA